jgi:hypothetical protein
MDKSKKDKIYELLEIIETDEIKKAKFIQWFHPRLSWYIDANIEYSNQQLDEIISFLSELIT